MLEGATQTQEVVYALSDLLRNNLRDIEILRRLFADSEDAFWRTYTDLY